MAVTSIDFADVLAMRLREAGYADASCRQLSCLKDGGISVRRLPATTTAEYYDGRRRLSYPVQVAVARESELQAMDECCAIAELVSSLDLASRNGTYVLTGAGIYTEPQALEVSGLPYVWQCRVAADLTTTCERI